MKVLIIGDSCKDVFIYGNVNRLSPEAPVPVFNPRRKIENDGMARNVSNNVESLDSTIYTITNNICSFYICICNHKNFSDYFCRCYCF